MNSTVKKVNRIRDERIAIQVTADEKSAITKLAQQKGLNVSSYVRLILSDLVEKNA